MTTITDEIISSSERHELLKYSALSVNLIIRKSDRADDAVFVYYPSVGSNFEKHEWNPLDNNEQAFTLMVNHGMEVYVDNHPRGCECVEVESHTIKVGRFIYDILPNSEASARLAIVRCAAEIGKLKEKSY